MSKAMKAWMEMIQTCRRISCAAIVIAPNPVTIDVAVNMTTIEETLRNDNDSPLCRPHRLLRKDNRCNVLNGLAAIVHHA